jgi:peptidyl-tRNA hydrolase, PTH1 family
VSLRLRNRPAAKAVPETIRGSQEMKLVVGLGNPGRKYEGTRHNLGYAVLAAMVEKYPSSRPKEKFHGEVVETDLEGEKILLLAPLTYMNRSGLSVRTARDFYGLADSDLLVVCDDLNLPLGKMRFRSGGSAGGQKGLEDIIRVLGTEEFPRLRIGIGSPPEGWDASDYVLGRFPGDQRAEIDEAIKQAAEAVAGWVRQGLAYCMNHYN